MRMRPLFGLEHARPHFGWRRLRALVEQWRVDVARAERARAARRGRAPSALICWVRPRNPNFDETYAAPARSRAVLPTSELMLMIVPVWRARIPGRNACTQ